MVCVLANGGRRVFPHLIKSRARPAEPIAGLRPDALLTIRRGMERVVYGKHGTATDAGIQGLCYGGKTGTAQSGGGEDHAWYTGFAPSAQPRFVFVVTLEHGGSGGHAAAPLAKDLLTFMRDRGMLGPVPPR